MPQSLRRSPRSPRSRRSCRGRFTLAALLLASGLGGGSASAAEGPADWNELYDARLLEVADGRTRAVVENLTSLRSRVDRDDPLHGEVAWWLAQARFALGDVEGARESLAEARRYRGVRDLAIAFEGQLEYITREVKSLPLRESFEGGVGPLVHAWRQGPFGRVVSGTPARLAPLLEDGLTEFMDLPLEEVRRASRAPPAGTSPAPEDPAVIWTVVVRDMRHDHLLVNLGQAARHPTAVRFQAQAVGFPGYIRLIAVDERGREYASDYYAVPTEGPVALDYALTDFYAVDPKSARVRPHGTAIRELRFEDITGYLSADRGTHAFWIDDLEIR